ncbi:nucleoside recognition domain-containing protein [Paenibacillus daejeonensis]|uniref:nucleoside recognition domain-containing protein n=1 Tax=Paenibacillus daejeonensis TaxID=135193 RepID=UPI00036392F1|nr:nucleoside recognition domain-containing protein [Paenibacillus daejeonensis]
MLRTILYAISSLALVAIVVRMPETALQAALQGIALWWGIVFPGLLPFFVLAELLRAFGVLHALSVLLDAPMRRLLGWPGGAAWAIAIGWTAGYSAGAEATAALRMEQRISRRQGQWLLAFSHMPSPMLILIVIGAGFLHQPSLGILIALAVWLSALLGLVLLRLVRRPAPEPEDRTHTHPPTGLLRAAVIAMLEGHRSDGRSLGQVLGEAVTGSIQKLMTIGGLIIMGSLASRLLQLALPPALSPLAFSGLFDSHLGTYALSEAMTSYSTPLILGAIAATLCWGGWSSLLQARSACAGTDLRFGPFLLARIGHALLAFGVILALWEPYNRWLSPAVWSPSGADAWQPPLELRLGDLPSLWSYVPGAMVGWGVLWSFLLLGSFLYWVTQRRSPA